jgi:cellulose synthase/poly-beta-1,6-N-acetylglucosamine synthase-like glycosyltransferase
VSSTTELVCLQALLALDTAEVRLDLEPVRYDHTMGSERSARANVFRTDARLTWLGNLLNTMRLPIQIALVHLAGVVLPFLIYIALFKAGHDIVPAMYLVVVFTLLVTAALIWIEGLAALEPVDLPDAAGPAPPITAIIAAYLPNEASTILDTIETFLHMEYEGPIQIILAYNTPRDLPVESAIRRIARRDPRFLPLKVENSTSKAQNVNAGLAEATGEIIGIFDADHQPAPDAFSRAWRWIASGYDLVQGHCQVRNGGESRLSRTVAVEFEGIYAVSHPGRARLHGFGLFGGSNGYWRAELLRQTRMHGFMLTEDIDSSIRVVIEGHKIKSDPGLVSRELAPVNLSALWNQRLRWAQGWFQVSRRHIWPALTSGRIGWRQKFGLFHLLLWREVYPWLSLQMWPIIAFWVWKHGSVREVDWLIPIFVLTTLFTLSVGPGQVFFAYSLAAADVRRHKSWFWLYLFWAPFYSELKNCIGRVAQVKELMGERAWKVTPRAAATPGLEPAERLANPH